MSRLLTLGLHLVITKGGFLLVDEIENGIHWSVKPKLWHFLVETARALNVQVVATTHSKDCLDGLAHLHRTYPALAEHVSVHRLEAGRDTSVRFDGGASPNTSRWSWRLVDGEGDQRQDRRAVRRGPR